MKLTGAQSVNEFAELYVGQKITIHVGYNRKRNKKEMIKMSSLFTKKLDK